MQNVLRLVAPTLLSAAVDMRIDVLSNEMAVRPTHNGRILKGWFSNRN